MPHTRKTSKKQIKKSEPEREVLTSANYRVIADAFIFAIEDEYMNYRDFKKIQSIIDNKYWKPNWVPGKEIK